MILSQFLLPPKSYVRTFETFQPQKSLIHHYLDVFWKDLGAQPGTVHLSVNENAEPSVTPSRRIPTALREKFKGELDRLGKIRVLAKVDEPTAWVSSVGIATKKSGSLRICINPPPLNQAVKREAHQLPILDNLMPEIARAKTFFYRRPYRRLLALCLTWVQSIDHLRSPIRNVQVEKTPIWSFSIKRDLLEAKQICQLLTKVSARPADHKEPIRPLTQQETEFNWTEEHEKASGEVKFLLWLPPHYLAIKTQRPSLKCDTSKKGLGAAPLQRGKPIAHWDREKRYARIKKEMKAIVFSLEKLKKNTPRDATWKLKSYQKNPSWRNNNNEVQYKRDRKLYLADTLSRTYLPDTVHPTAAEFENINASAFLPVSTSRPREIHKVTENDEIL